MDFRFSKHAEQEIIRRGIPREFVEQTLQQPQQVIHSGERKLTYQSKVSFGGRVFLLRAIVAHDVEPPLVVTVYRTTKIDKYWEEK